MVSVVIPCHNAATSLVQAIDSAITQEGVSEVIVVDDSSTDDSANVAQTYGSRVKLIMGSWCNGNSARNAGLAAATGKWVQFLDADDLLAPNKIISQLSCAPDAASMLYSPLCIRIEHPDGSVADSITRPTPGADLIEQWLRWELCQTGAALWRIAALRDIGGWKEGLPCCQDNELTLRALKHGLKLFYFEGPPAIYRIWSEDTVCRRDPVRVVLQKTSLIDECIEWIRGNGKIKADHQRAAGQACFEMARTYARSDIDSACEYFRGRAARNLINIAGPACNSRYKILCNLFGFRVAERIASLVR